jgi:hypothetical protein
MKITRARFVSYVYLGARQAQTAALGTEVLSMSIVDNALLRIIHASGVSLVPLTQVSSLDVDESELIFAEKPSAGALIVDPDAHVDLRQQAPITGVGGMTLAEAQADKDAEERRKRQRDALKTVPSHKGGRK